MKFKYKIYLSIFAVIFCGALLLFPASTAAAGAENAGYGTHSRLNSKNIVKVALTKAGSSPHTPPIAMSVRFQKKHNGIRFSIELSHPVGVRSFTLASPNRLVIDLPTLSWKLSRPPKPDGHGLIRGYRYGQFRPGVSRFVIDLNRPARLSHGVLVPPRDGFGYRIIFDLTPTSQADFNRHAGWPASFKTVAVPDAPEDASGGPEPLRNPLRQIVVIDPGHGGIDDGTTGIRGEHEKDLVLPEGRYLADDLRERGYIVHMTRTDDTFIPLGKRVKMARDWHADLFISLHANSNSDHSIYGLSIYTLSEKGSDQAARRLAAKENNSDTIAGVKLSGQAAAVAPILIDLAQRDSINKSSRFAETALDTLRPVTSILNHNPHRSAAFRVLKAPDMPAVLIELGFLSNRHDADRMRTKYWRKRVAQAIATAVDHYFGHPIRTARHTGK